MVREDGVAVIVRGALVTGLVLSVLVSGCIGSAAPSGVPEPAAGEEVVWEVSGLAGTVAFEFHILVSGNGYCRMERAFSGGWGSESGLLSYGQWVDPAWSSAVARGDTDAHVATVNPSGTVQGAAFAQMGIGWSSSGWSNMTDGESHHSVWAGFDVRAPTDGISQIRVLCTDATADIQLDHAARVIPVTSTNGGGAGVQVWAQTEAAVNVVDRFELTDAVGTVFVGFQASPGQSGPLDPAAFRDGAVTVTTPEGTKPIRLADWGGWSSHYTLMDRGGDYALEVDQVAVGAGSILGLMAEFR